MESGALYLLAADVVLFGHVLFVAFVVIGLLLVLGAKPLVSSGAPRRDRHRCRAVVVRGRLSSDYPGNGVARKGRRCRISRLIRGTLAGGDPVLPGAGVGIRRLLYGLRGTGGSELVPGASTSVRGRGTPQFHRNPLKSEYLFVLFRALHSAVHCKINIVIIRFTLYVLSCGCLFFILLRPATGFFS